jgi:hypothetical protein
VGTYQVSRNMLGSLVEAAGRESDGTCLRFEWSGGLAPSGGGGSAGQAPLRLRDNLAYPGSPVGRGGLCLGDSTKGLRIGVAFAVQVRWYAMIGYAA